MSTATKTTSRLAPIITRYREQLLGAAEQLEHLKLRDFFQVALVAEALRDYAGILEQELAAEASKPAVTWGGFLPHANEPGVRSDHPRTSPQFINGG